MLNLVLLNLALQVLASFSKKQPFEVVFYFVVKGVGGLNYALLCGCERSEAKELPFSFFRERKGLYFACGS